MITKHISILFSVLVTLLLSACSPINSMAPFDDQQAAVIARGMRPTSR